MSGLIDDAKKAFETIKQKTTTVVDKTQVKVKLNLEIKEKEVALDKAYLEMGKKYYETNKDSDDNEIKNITKLLSELSENKEKLKELDN